ncbi:PepSY domain-containing protein [Defluviimonas sp. SAOS-178_SWC]|uniref:PepSY domain-containing protein n=1 Tax=Defluviimonas sp. SAOS-178_SWC TaxID=3121287 RepID=UPI003221887F
MTPKKTLATAAALILGLVLPALAGSTPDAATQEKIAADLTAQGYDVRKIDDEDGMIEVYAVKDGKMYEIYLDAELKVVRTKEEG